MSRDIAADSMPWRHLIGHAAINMCIALRTDMCMDMCIAMRTDMCMDMCTDTYGSDACSHVSS